MKSIARVVGGLPAHFSCIRCMRRRSHDNREIRPRPNVAGSLPAGWRQRYWSVTFALLLVLAAVFGVAFLVKRMRMATGAGQQWHRSAAQASLGAKERAVIIRVGNERLLLGVASGR